MYRVALETERIEYVYWGVVIIYVMGSWIHEIFTRNKVLPLNHKAIKVKTSSSKKVSSINPHLNAKRKSSRPLSSGPL